MTKKARNKKKRESFLRKAFRWALVAALWAVLLVGALCAWYARELPDITRDATFQRKVSITVKAADGSIIARYGETQGKALGYDELPPDLVHAVIAIEDRRFFIHPGIDPLGLVRAVFINFRAHRFVQGGSTITQQLAKNLFLSQERTLKRKIQEAMLAAWLEYELSKKEIISAYLNRVYLGAGAYGVDAASQVYFKKNAKDLTLMECATLAGLLKAPSRYSPQNNPKLSKQRALVVLQAMTEAGYITKAQAREAEQSHPAPPKDQLDTNSARYYADWVVDGLEDLIGTPQEDLIVETSFDPVIQKAAELSLQNTLAEAGEAKHISQGAVIVMRPSGAVLAMIGGRNYGESQFNRATQGRRQPGSSFKPVVYLTALEQGWAPDMMVIDEPILEGKYRPENFGGKYYGELTLANALALSLNTVSFHLAQSVGPASIVNMARRLGIISPLDPNLSLALGSYEVSMLELATAYSVLANGGASVFPYAIKKITSEKGKLYYERSPDRRGRQVVNGYLVRELSDMMQGVLQYGTGTAARLPFPASGKTGTSQDSRDAWFMGFTGEIVTAVWMGNDDNTHMKAVTGGSYPARVWRDTMMAARGRYPSMAVYSGDAAGPEFQNFLSRIIGGADDAQIPVTPNDGRAERAAFTPAPYRHMEAEGESSSLKEQGRFNN